MVGGFGNKTVLKPGTGGEGWDAGYAATLQVPGSEPVEEGFTWRNVLASYVHLHFGSNPRLAAALVERCRQVAAGTLTLHALGPPFTALIKRAMRHTGRIRLHNALLHPNKGPGKTGCGKVTISCTRDPIRAGKCFSQK